MDIQAIPFTAIVEYFRIYELRDFDDFVYIIRLMDNVFLEENDKVNQSERKKDGGGNADAKNNNKR